MQWRRGLAAVGVMLQLWGAVPRGTLAQDLAAGPGGAGTPAGPLQAPPPGAAGRAAAAAGGAMAAWLERTLGPGSEWAQLTAPAADLPAATEAALAAWLRRRFPAAGPLVLDALPGHLARQALRAAGQWGPRTLQEALARDWAVWEAYAAAGLGPVALDPRPAAAPAAAWLAGARVYWHALELELAQAPGGADLWTALRQAAAPGDAGAPMGPGAGLARRLAGPLAWFYDAYAAPGPDGAPPRPLPRGPWAAAPGDPGAAPGGDGGITVRVAGQPLDLADPPVLEHGTVLVPLRAFVTALGAAVEWDPVRRRVTAQLGDRRVRLALDRRSATVSAGGAVRRVRLPLPPQVRDGRVYVPLRLAAQALGAAVHWDPETRTVDLAPGAAPDLPLPPPPDPARTVYLTFDDGPDPELTPRILDTLWEWDVSATFFVVGERAERHPELLRRMADEGHAIGTHSWDHAYGNVYRSPAAFVDSLDRTAAVIAQATGGPVRLARAPGGTGTVALRDRPDTGQFWAAAADAGYMLYNWNIDSGDSQPGPRLTAADLLDRVRAGARARAGGPLIVLFHDTATHGPTAEALPEVIAWLLEQGYEFAALPTP